MEFTRRKFLHTAGAVALTLGLSRLEMGCRSDVQAPTDAGTSPAATPAAVAAIPVYRTWEDL